MTDSRYRMIRLAFFHCKESVTIDSPTSHQQGFQQYKLSPISGTNIDGASGSSTSKVVFEIRISYLSILN